MTTYSIADLHRMWDEANKKSRKPAQNIEHNTQAECFDWFRSQFPGLSDLYWSIPNGGYRSKKTAAIMKKEGQRAGVPDTFFAYPAKGYHGLFIEYKKSRTGKKGQLIDKGHTSENQDRVIAALRAAGYKVEICYCLDQFKQIMVDYIMA